MESGMQLILNSTHDAMIAVDLKGVITLFNTAAERLTGIKVENAIDKFVGEVVTDTRLPYILETGKSELNQQQNLGNIKIITNRMPVRDDKGNMIGAIAVFRDITDVIELAEEITNLKEMKSMLEAIFNATQDAISVVDQDGNGVMINPAYTRITGLSEKDVIGKPATVDIAEGESIHFKVIKTKLPVKGALLKVGPGHREVLVNAAPIIVDGELRGSVGVLHDLTEISKLSHELKQAKEIIRKLEAKYTFEDIVGQDPLMIAAIDKARNAAATPATVLLRGESGTGKEIFAHSIHNSSERKYRQFVRVNCSAISESLLESELFGYEEGAFTGAKKGGKKGLFEEANGGTIFLDEIGELSLALQVKILRALQEREFERVGGTETIKSDVRIIAATNRDLDKMAEEGRFREDLLYRLKVIPLKIPALRERKEDIPLLVEFFINKYSKELNKGNITIEKEVLEILMNYDFPGNIRELENIIERAVILSAGARINPGSLPKEVVKGAYAAKSDEFIIPDGGISLEAVEESFVRQSLEMSKGNQTQAANLLGISRHALIYRMAKFKLK